VLPFDASLAPRPRRRFLQEARALAKLRHPNVVAVHDVVEGEGLVAYAMEWVEGITLARLLDHLAGLGREPTMEDVRRVLGAGEGDLRGANPTTFLVRTGLAIARALEAVHAAGLVHRDVKPSNVLLRRDGTALLSDFGLVREGEGTLQTQTGSFLGTPAYAPPEQPRGETERIDARSDVYALGATLYHALTRELPFRGRSTAEILRQVEAERLVPLRRRNPPLPRDLETIVAKAMGPEPARRYASAGEMADDLERLLELQPIRAKRSGLPQRAWKTVRRNRPAVFGALAGGILIALIATALITYLSGLPRRIDHHVRSARLLLFDPTHWGQIWAARNRPFMTGDLSNHPQYQDDPAIRERYRQALAHFERALALGADDPLVRSESRVLQQALSILIGSLGERDPPTGASRLLQSYAAAWDPADLGRGNPFTPPEGTDSKDLRELGLLAYLLGDAESCHAAWERVSSPIGDDPFLDAAQGVLLLDSHLPGSAWVRLDSAIRAFPEAGYLVTRFADAALQFGELEQAVFYLEQARGLDQNDPTFTLQHLEAEVAAACGQFERAEALYEVNLRSYWRGRAPTGYAHLLEILGGPERALHLYREVLGDEVWADYYGPLFLERADSWWASLSSEDRVGRLAAAIAEFPGQPGSFLTLVETWRGQLDIRVEPRASGAPAAPRLHFGVWTPSEHLSQKIRESANQSSPPPPSHPHGASLGDLVLTTEVLRMDMKVRNFVPGRLRGWVMTLSLSIDRLVARWSGGGAGWGTRHWPRVARTVRGLVEARGLRMAATVMVLSHLASAQSPLFYMPGAKPGDHHGGSVAGLGDLDGDGYGDFGVVNRGGLVGNGGSGRVTIYAGGPPSTPASTPRVLYAVDGTDPANALTGVASAGDVNNDGTPDIMNIG